jgi:hypothetical protein
MLNVTERHIDEETIRSIGLRPSERAIMPQLTVNPRVFEFSDLEDVFVMEGDFYGNPMPQGSCFLVFPGRHGLLGRQLRLEKLRNASAEDIQKMVQSINEG